MLMLLDQGPKSLLWGDVSSENNCRRLGKKHREDSWGLRVGGFFILVIKAGGRSVSLPLESR